MDKVILVKLGELWLKGRNRGDFVDQLVFNIVNSTGIDKKNIYVKQGRIYIENYDKKTLENLKYVFGITGYVEAYKTDVSMEAIEEVSYKIAEKEVASGANTFKIAARRGEKSFEKNSMEINTEIGEKVLKKFKNLKVDIHNPDLVLSIEVREEGVYAYPDNKEIPASGGLPVGISSRGLLMLSGGIDSPVAGWMMLKRGMATDAIYFHSPPYTGDKTKEKILDICRTLSRWRGEGMKVFIPHFADIQVEISKKVPDPFWTLLHRRFMTEISERLAKEHGYKALITGENLGQVASQTIENITAVSFGIETPIMRPLVGFDKQETIDLAKRIETYETSILPYEDCCTVFASQNPKIKASPDDLLGFEKTLDKEAMIKNALEKMEVYMVSFEGIKKVE